MYMFIHHSMRCYDDFITTQWYYYVCYVIFIIALLVFFPNTGIEKIRYLLYYYFRLIIVICNDMYVMQYTYDEWY